LKAGFSFLDKLLSLGAEAQFKGSESLESKSARRYTVGGLHMTVIDELHERNMLAAIDPESLESDLSTAQSYVEMRAVLKPIDFYALIDTLRTSSPIIAEVLKSFVGPLYEQGQKEKWTKHLEAQQWVQAAASATTNRQRGATNNQQSNGPASRPPADKFQLFLAGIDDHMGALNSVLTRLEDDYRRSKQIEMVMWTPGSDSRPYGVVDLDLGDYEADALRPKLTDGTFHIIGKVTRIVAAGDSINLLQKSALYSALSLIHRVIEELLSDYEQHEKLAPYRSGLAKAREVIERFGLLQVPGPAVRVAAMSVCI
jgi:hypothetical protein